MSRYRQLLLALCCLYVVGLMVSCVVGGRCREDKQCPQTHICQQGQCQEFAGRLQLIVRLPKEDKNVASVVATIKGERLEEPLNEVLLQDGSGWRLSVQDLSRNATFEASIKAQSSTGDVRYIGAHRKLQPRLDNEPESLTLRRYQTPEVWKFPCTQQARLLDMTQGPQGHLFHVGMFKGTLHVGQDRFTSTSWNLILVSLTLQGEVRWARHIASDFSVQGRRVRVDAQGYVYVAGVSTAPTFNIDGYHFVNKGDKGTLDAFLLKLDPQGKVVWGRTAGGPHSHQHEALTLKSNGDACVSGRYLMPITFLESNTTLSLQSKGRIYLACYRSDGSLRWAQSFGGENATSMSRPKALVEGEEGHLYLSGSFSGDWTTGVPSGHTAKGSQDAFVVKINSQGKVIWFHSLGGSTSYADSVNSLSWSVTQKALAACGTLSGKTQVGASQLQAQDRQDAFVAILSPEGSWTWARLLGGLHNEVCKTVGSDGTGLFLGGDFQQTMSVEGVPATLSQTGKNSGIWAARMKWDGHVEWLRQVKGSYTGKTNRLVVSAFGELWMQGFLHGTGSLDGVSFSSLQDEGAMESAFVWRVQLP